MAQGLGRLHETNPLPYEPVFLVTRQMFEQNPKFHGFLTIPCNAPFLSFRELFEIPKIIKANKAVLYHSPSFSSLLWSSCPWIQTVHDLNHLHYGTLAKKLYYRLILKRFILRSQRLMTVSRFSQREIAQWTGVSPSLIDIVYNALDPVLTQRPSQEEMDAVLGARGLKSGRYFFCLSNPKPHTNVRRLREAYDRYRQGSRNEDLPPLVLSFHYESPPRGVLGLGALSEHEIRILLAGSRALFFPSYYEGFGLPPAEAAALGVPIVASKIPPHEEALVDVLDDVHWVDPHSLKDWTEAFAQVEQNLIPKPTAQASASLLRRFSVERLAEDMDRIYRRVLSIKS
jgi:alpha-1,3-rhamnosyl/mannosyltransferase